MTHALKICRQYYEAQEKGNKLFELRKDDRPYMVGDYFLSQEFNFMKNAYTGRETKYLITYVMREADLLGLKKGYCILQLKPIENE